jgi:hypothetical protein
MTETRSRLVNALRLLLRCCCVLRCVKPTSGSSSTIVPYGADQTVYLVVDSFCANGAVYRETLVERTDLETVTVDLMSG